jgi:hypothetical protein
VQFQIGALLQPSNTPSLRVAGFEDSGSTELAEVLSAVAFAKCSRSAPQARRAPRQGRQRRRKDDDENENEAPSGQKTYHLNWLVTA